MTMNTKKGVTLQETIEWILQNRRNDAFKNYSREKIEFQLREACANNMFFHTIDDSGNLSGVVCCHYLEGKDTVFIDDILITQPGAIKRFITHFNNVHPTYKLMGMIRGRVRIFNDAHKLERRIK